MTNAGHGTGNISLPLIPTRICVTLISSFIQSQKVFQSIQGISFREDHQGTMNYNGKLQTKEAAKDDVLSVGI